MNDADPQSRILRIARNNTVGGIVPREKRASIGLGRALRAFLAGSYRMRVREAEWKDARRSSLKGP
jgi:hypothetical protein